MIKRLFVVTLFIPLWLLPRAAYANGMTPIMMATMVHIVIGNAIIGLGEGALLAWLLKVKMRVMIPMMILANYISAWIGGMCASGLTLALLKPNFYNAMLAMWVAVALSFVFTLLVEFPFAYNAQRKLKNPMGKLIGIFVASQVLSYIALSAFYYNSTSFTLLTETEVDHSLSFLQKTNAVLYYISTEDGDVYSMELNSLRAPEKVYDLNSTHGHDNLFAFPAGPYREDAPEESLMWDLWARQQVDNTNIIEPVKVLSNFATKAALEGELGWDFDYFKEYDIQHALRRPSNMGIITDLREIEDREWHASVDWLRWGMHLTNKAEGENIIIAFSVPLFQLNVLKGTFLPGDIIIFQLGEQICAFECETRKIGVITEGRGPAIGLNN